MKPSKELRVWGGLSLIYGHPFSSTHGQARLIVRARSRAAALRALHSAGVRIADSYVRDYWSVTRNVKELEITSGKEGVVFIVDRMGQDAKFEQYIKQETPTCQTAK